MKQVESVISVECMHAKTDIIMYTYTIDSRTTIAYTTPLG